MTLFALRLAERPTNSRATFGYHRVGILVALANGISLIVVASLIVHEAYRRFVAPPAVNAVELLVIASVGLAANLAMLALLERGHNEDLNVRSAWLHVVGDSLGSVGVIASAIVLMITGWPYVDPIASVLIAFLILANGWGVVRDAAAILLELPPRTLSVKTIESGILAVEGVQGLHDLHLWAITPELPCLSAHVVVAEQTVSEAGEIVEAVSKKLEQMGIAHTTLQVEFERCDRAKGTCTLETLR
jgi:cobalt-zinc-cadmium efflux system protein